jgi:hypothetical protein
VIGVALRRLQKDLGDQARDGVIDEVQRELRHE